MNLLACPFDGTSRVPGVGAGAAALAQALAPKGTQIRTLRSESRNSAIYCRMLRDETRRSLPAMTVGGEHLITLPLLESLRERKPDLRLVVLDAHHDAYPHPIATHFSLFYYVLNELRIPTLFLGVRYEIEKAFGPFDFVSDVDLDRNPGAAYERIDAFIAGAPFHLSVDLDVLNPDEFPAVSAPVKGGLLIASASRLLERIVAKGPATCDVVEYNGLLDRDGKLLKRIEPVLHPLREWLRG